MRPRRARAALLLFAVTALVIYAVGIEPRWVAVRRVRVPCPGLTAPASFVLFADVDFPRAAAGRRVVRRVVRDERPDAILVAGDFFDRPETIANPEILREGAQELASLEAPAGRILAPGEEESDGLPAVRAALSGGAATIGENVAVPLDTRGGRIDLYVADTQTDPAPWGLTRISGRNTVASDGRTIDTSVVFDGDDAASWNDVVITLAFLVGGPDAYVDLRFGWRQPGGAETGTGWRLVRHEYHPTFRLIPRLPGDLRVTGRIESGYEPEPGIWHRARIVLTNEGTLTRIRARFWPERGVEPRVWTIDAEATGPGRGEAGTIAFGGRFGDRALADLSVTSPDGRILLRERFDDRERFLATWRQPSRLLAWAASPAQGPRLVLAHDPDIVFDLDRIGAPPPVLVLAGHTHGGQIRLPFLPPFYTSTRLPRRYASGFHVWRGIPLYVTPGIGTSVLPARFLVRPEVTLIDLVPERQPR
jgi:predicted MPP superfamily phosphohydrolase